MQKVTLINWMQQNRNTEDDNDMENTTNINGDRVFELDKRRMTYKP